MKKSTLQADGELFQIKIMMQTEQKSLNVLTKAIYQIRRYLPHILLAVFILMAALISSVSAQSTSPQMINVFFEYGKADYLDLGGKKVLPADSTVPQPNLESWVIGYKAFNLIGDFVYNPSFYYAINSERLKGKTRTIEFKTISKYPDLVKRYQAIRPSSVNFIITAELYSGSGNLYKTVNFKVSGNDLNYFESRSAKNLQSPVSPSSGKWKYAFSTMSYADSGDIFTDKDYSDENELRQLLKNADTLRPTQAGAVKIALNIKWADDAIDEIGLLYDQYEKEGKKIDDELKAVKNADKLVKPVAAYNKDDEMSAPFEEESKSAEVFKEGETVGLRAKGKIVFSSDTHYSPEAIDEKNRLFSFYSKESKFPNQMQLFDARGKRLTVNGYTDFSRVGKGESPDTYYVIIADGKSIFYTTKQAYGSSDIAKFYARSTPHYLTQSQFDAFVTKDKGPRMRTAFDSEIEKSTCQDCVFLTPNSQKDFRRGTLYTVDNKFQVLSTETIYY